MRGRIRRALAAAVLVLGTCASLGAADPARLSPEEARRAAWAALQGGRPHVALQIAEALRPGAPDDFELIFLSAEAQRVMGNAEGALVTAREAWRAAQDPGHKFDAAHLVAKAHYAGGRPGRAQFWLRRAAQLAPDDTARQVAARDFRHVRDTSPWTVRLAFGAFPTSNINNGSTADTIEINGLQFDVPVTGQPHSGTGFHGAVDVGYRTALGDGRMLRLGLRLKGTTYRLSSDAKALGSGLRGRDFASAAAEFRAGLSFAPASTEGPWGARHLDALVGRSWYGGNPLANYARVSARQDLRLGADTVGSVGLSLERQWRLDDGRASADVAALSFGLRQRLDTGGRLDARLTLRNTQSASALVDSREVKPGFLFIA
ncbi:MAG: hypothetical protein AAF761_04265, partial [Pseudomonadota bacterium]